MSLFYKLVLKKTFLFFQDNLLRFYRRGRSLELDTDQTVRLRDGIWTLTARFGDMVYHKLHSRDHREDDYERQACKICSPTLEPLGQDETPEEFVVSAIVLLILLPICRTECYYSGTDF